MAKYFPQRIRDPLHDLIDFRAEKFENTMWEVLQTRPFQRLRRVKQLAFSELVFPGATHTRFAHSVGVFHIARQLMAIIEEHLGGDIDPERKKVALAAALVHDIGHGPFSHSFEEAGEKLNIPFAQHELVSAELIKNSEISEVLSKIHPSFAEDVAQLIAADGPTDIYSAVVSSQFDADRLDYIQRDPLMTGTQHSRIDFTWLRSNLEIGTVKYGVDDQFAGETDTFVLNSKAFFAAETYILGLFHLYPTVYFHKATRSAEKLFTYLLVRLHYLVHSDDVDKSGLTPNHPLVIFLLKADQDNFMPMDDMLIWGSIHQMVTAKDECLSEIARRLRDRKLLKCVDARGELFPREFAIDVPVEILEAACASLVQSVEDWNEDNKTVTPRIILDQGKRPTYKRFSESKGPLNRIHINMNGDLVDVSEVSKAVKASGTFKFLRAYIDENDNEAKKFLEQEVSKIAQGVNHDLEH